MGLGNDDNPYENSGYFYKKVPFKITGSSGSCNYTKSRKNYEEAKSRALTLANETLSSDTAKQSCKNFLATLLSLAGTKLAGSLGVQKLIQGLVHGDIDPETFTAELQIDSYLSTDERKCLIPFLKRSLGFFQTALLKGELSIDGIRPRLPPIRSLTMRTENTKPNKLMGHIGFTSLEVTRNQSIKVKGVTENNKSKELTENSKAKEVTEIKQMTEVKLEAEKTNIVTANSTKADSKVENIPIKNVADVFKPDGNNMIPCKGCGANCKDIRKHLTKTRYSIKCESKYSSEQLSALDIGGATPEKESTENSKAKEVTKIRQNTEVKLEARYGFWFWATAVVETATLFVILKVIWELGIPLGIWLLSFLAKYGPMDILDVFWILAVVITVILGAIYLGIAYAFDLMNLDFDGTWLGAEQERIMQSPSELLNETKCMIILDVFIEFLLKPYFEGVSDN